MSFSTQGLGSTQTACPTEGRCDNMYPYASAIRAIASRRTVGRRSREQVARFDGPRVDIDLHAARGTRMLTNA